MIGSMGVESTMTQSNWPAKCANSSANRSDLGTDPAYRPDAAALGSVRRALWAEVVLFAGIPVAAAAMARGYGM